MRQQTDFPLPSDLPRPKDDGAADHLAGMRMPEVSLRSTIGRVICLSELPALRTVIYCYPMTGVPGKPPTGELGRDSRCAGLHATELQFSGSPSGIPAAWN
jgi:hypothetical protein